MPDSREFWAALSAYRSVSQGCRVSIRPFADMVFSKDGQGWLCAHSHMSLNRGVPQTSHANRPVKAW
jgi:hypothetical protein